MKQKRKTGCLIGAVLLLLFIGGLVFGVMQIINNPGRYGVGKNGAVSSNKEIQAIVDATGMDLESATEAYNVFRQVSDNISVIYSVTYDEMLNDVVAENTKGYRVKTEFSNNVILTTLEGKLYSIRYADYDYYINGSVNGYFYNRNGELIAGTKQ